MHSALVNNLAVLSFIPAFVAATSWTVGNAVKIESGPVVEGHASSWQPGVSEYLGIPFAQPPIGPLRFAAPQPYKGGSTTIKASKYSPDCPANPVGFTNKTTINSPKGVVLASLGQYGDTFDEDCLTLNVWTKPQTGEKSKAVLVWIYGGGFALGNTASPAYNGARLAEDQDVVVVSMNYRLNIFGFPGAPGLPDQNVGLLDQRLAVEWVRDNIAAFGGDPKRITLFGESAGGASVDMYSYAWTKDPIVNGFIPESGTAALGDTLGGNKNVAAGWFKASERAGCGGSNTTAEASISCMRNKPWKEVIAAIKPAGGAAAMGGMGDYGPSPDGKVVFNDYKARAAAGNFIKRPMLVGNNANEVSLFAVILGSTSNLASPMLKMANMIFGCPSGTAAKARVDNKVKSWRYMYAGDWPNQNLADGAGAFHGSEIGLVFGSIEYQQTFYGEMIKEKISYPDTTEQKALTKTMMTAWASFAKDPENGLDKLGWPVYDSTKPTLVKLGEANSSTVAFVDPATVDRSCGMMSSLAGMLGASGGMAGLTGLLQGATKGGSGFNLGALAGLKGPSTPQPSAAAPPTISPPVFRRRQMKF